MSLLLLTGCGGGGTSAAMGPGGGSGGPGSGGGGSGSNGAVGPFTAGRTKYIRTDATTEYLGWANSGHWIIYNPPTNAFFVTDPLSNHIFVLDAETRTQIGSIIVPGAFSLDDTPDHTTLYVGTLMGDVYTISAATMKVTHKYPAAQIGPNGYPAFTALVMADGRVALLSQSGDVFPIAADGSLGFAIWNPADNSLAAYRSFGTISGTLVPCGPNSTGILGFTRTADRSALILGMSGTLCEMDETSGQGKYAQTGDSMYRLTTSPDGNYIILPSYPGYADVYDAQTLKLVAHFPVNGDTSSAAGFMVSADSKTLFTPNDAIIYAYDLTTGQQVGWLPNLTVQFSAIGAFFTVGAANNPNLQATDGTGLLAGPMEEGVGFIDTTTMRTGPVGTQFLNGYLNPATGPVIGGTQVQLPETNAFGALSAMYFGSNEATDVTGTAGLISATAPAGAPGPSDVYTFTKDGDIQILPEGFSYGPAILEVAPNLSTAEGGGTGFIYGYGLGPVNSSSVPGTLHVTVGGTPVSITGFTGNAYGTAAPPFPLEAVAYTIPPGTVGSAADVTVSTPSGTATARGALSYLPAVKRYLLPGSRLAQGIYDPFRDVYYFTDTNMIRVFSRTQGQWLAPITITPPAGATQRLWGIALSPNGSQLAVADSKAAVIYVLDPTNPASVKTFPIYQGPDAGLVFPAGVAISDSGMVYYTVFWSGITGGDGLLKLDTSSGAITSYRSYFGGPGLRTDVYLRTLISSDNSRVFFNDDGSVLYIDTATDHVVVGSLGQGCCYGDYDLALSSNQAQVEGTGFLYDSSLQVQSQLALNDRETLNMQYVYGIKVSADGNLVFVPSMDAIDVMNGKIGNYIERVALPVTLSPNYDALAADGKDNILVAITGTYGDGIAIIDLSSIPDPPAVTYGSRISRTASRNDVETNVSRPTSSMSVRSNIVQFPRIQHITRTLLSGHK